METLLTCKEGYEKILSNEVASYHGKLQAKGRGWILAQWDDVWPKNLCFAYHILEDPIKVSATSVNGLTEKLLNIFTKHIKEKRIDKPWTLLFSSSGEEKLISRAKIIEKNWLEKLKKKMSRVSKLSQNNTPRGSELAEGFFVHFTDFDKAIISFKALAAKQQRMQMDPDAPSRSYLKIEEAFQIFGYAPGKNEAVVDLGAAPGGWSHSALKRDAKVIAIDNGPLKGPVASHPKVTHLKVDAFKYAPLKPADWLLCDILDKPEAVLKLLNHWLSHQWCRRFIVNLKIGKNDPIVLLKAIRNPQNGIASQSKFLLIKQLYHDRQEITLMGEIKE